MPGCILMPHFCTLLWVSELGREHLLKHSLNQTPVQKIQRIVKTFGGCSLDLSQFLLFHFLFTIISPLCEYIWLVVQVCPVLMHVKSHPVFFNIMWILTILFPGWIMLLCSSLVYIFKWRQCLVRYSAIYIYYSYAALLLKVRLVFSADSILIQMHLPQTV